jgi:hypothetical protein
MKNRLLLSGEVCKILNLLEFCTNLQVAAIWQPELQAHSGAASPDGEIGRRKGLKIRLVKYFLLKLHGRNVKKDKALQAHKALLDDLFW